MEKPDVAWFVVVDGQKRGPYDQSHLVAELLTLHDPRTPKVWKAGMSDWVAASEIPELARFVPPPVTASAPLPMAPLANGSAADGSAKVPASPTFASLFRHRFRRTQWWAAGLTLVALGPGQCQKLLADRDPLGGAAEVGFDLAVAVILNMLVFGAVFAMVLATVDRRRGTQVPGLRVGVAIGVAQAPAKSAGAGLAPRASLSGSKPVSLARGRLGRPVPTWLIVLLMLAWVLGGFGLVLFSK